MAERLTVAQKQGPGDGRPASSEAYQEQVARLPSLTREYYMTDATPEELDEAADALRRRPSLSLYPPISPVFDVRPGLRTRLVRWFKRNFDGDAHWVDLDVQRQLDALVSAHVMEFATSRAVGPGMKKRLANFNLRYNELRSRLVRE